MNRNYEFGEDDLTRLAAVRADNKYSVKLDRDSE